MPLLFISMSLVHWKLLKTSTLSLGCSTMHAVANSQKTIYLFHILCRSSPPDRLYAHWAMISQRHCNLTCIQIRDEQGDEKYQETISHEGGPKGFGIVCLKKIVGEISRLSLPSEHWHLVRWYMGNKGYTACCVVLVFKDSGRRNMCMQETSDQSQMINQVLLEFIHHSKPERTSQRRQCLGLAPSHGRDLVIQRLRKHSRQESKSIFEITVKGTIM